MKYNCTDLIASCTKKLSFLLQLSKTVKDGYTYKNVNRRY